MYIVQTVKNFAKWAVLRFVTMCAIGLVAIGVAVILGYQPGSGLDGEPIPDIAAWFFVSGGIIWIACDMHWSGVFSLAREAKEVLSEPPAQDPSIKMFTAFLKMPFRKRARSPHGSDQLLAAILGQPDKTKAAKAK